MKLIRKFSLFLFAVSFALSAALLAGCEKKDDGALRMITDATFPPYEFLRGREIVGIDVEIGKAVARKLGKRFRCATADFVSVFLAVECGKAHFAASGITITEDRKKTFDFSVPYVTTGLVVIYRKENPFKDVAQLKRKKIGVMAGTTSETYVREQLKQSPLCSRLPNESCEALKAGRVEFVITDIGLARGSLKDYPELMMSDFITREEYAIAIRKGQPELLKAVNETIAEVKKDGRLEKWITEFTAESDALKDK